MKTLNHTDFKKGKKYTKEEIKKLLEKIQNRSPEEEEKSCIRYCKEAIKDKMFKLKKWKLIQKDWSHDHCNFCGAHISDKKESENEAYGNSMGDWFCKKCFQKYKDIIGLEEVK